jgi:tripeptidyl-peptidase-1
MGPSFERMHVSRRDEQEDLKHCDKKMTPPCYRALYGLPQHSQPLPKDDLAIFQTGYSQYYQKNLDEYFTSFAPNVPNGTHPELVSINGGTAPAKHAGGASGEANLDFMVAYGLLGPVNITL